MSTKDKFSRFLSQPPTPFNPQQQQQQLPPPPLLLLPLLPLNTPPPLLPPPPLPPLQQPQIQLSSSKTPVIQIQESPPVIDSRFWEVPTVNAEYFFRKTIVACCFLELLLIIATIIIIFSFLGNATSNITFLLQSIHLVTLIIGFFFVGTRCSGMYTVSTTNTLFVLSIINVLFNTTAIIFRVDRIATFIKSDPGTYERRVLPAEVIALLCVVGFLFVSITQAVLANRLQSIMNTKNFATNIGYMRTTSHIHNI
jgi:hypothetical protein